MVGGAKEVGEAGRRERYAWEKRRRCGGLVGRSDSRAACVCTGIIGRRAVLTVPVPQIEA